MDILKAFEDDRNFHRNNKRYVELVNHLAVTYRDQKDCIQQWDTYEALLKEICEVYDAMAPFFENYDKKAVEERKASHKEFLEVSNRVKAIKKHVA